MKKRETFIMFIIGILVLSFFSFVYTKLVGTFVFVDEFNSFISAYFMIKGRQLYSEIFFNHQPLMAYISYGIEVVLRPKSLFQLVAFHRYFVIAFSFVSGLLLIFRFQVKGLIFLLFFESLKYYYFGHLFLAEALIPYGLVYLIGVLWERWHGRYVYKNELYITTIVSWLIVFLREPYIPLALFLLVLMLYTEEKRKKIGKNLIIFCVLSAIILAIQPLNDYFFNLVKVNMSTVIAGELEQQGNLVNSVMKSFFYPMLIFFKSGFSKLKVILMILSLEYYLFLFFTGLYRKHRKIALASFIILGLSIPRIVQPGSMFFPAYKLLPWLSVLLALIIFPLIESKQYLTLKFWISHVMMMMGLLVFLYAPPTFIWEKHNIYQEFSEHYADHYIKGEIFRRYSVPNDLMFVNDYDSIRFWQAGLDSSYKYAFRYPVMTSIDRYEKERERMFLQTPPDFYDAAFCDPVKNNGIPLQVLASYHNVLENEKRTCLFVHEEKIKKLTEEQKKSGLDFGFSIEADTMELVAKQNRKE